MPTRCRMPPDSSNGYGRRPPVGDAHLGQPPEGLGAAGGARQPAAALVAQALLDVPPAPHQRVEHGEGVLEDHPDLGTAVPGAAPGRAARSGRRRGTAGCPRRARRPGSRPISARAVIDLPSRTRPRSRSSRRARPQDRCRRRSAGRPPAVASMVRPLTDRSGSRHSSAAVAASAGSAAVGEPLVEPVAEDVHARRGQDEQAPGAQGHERIVARCSVRPSASIRPQSAAPGPTPRPRKDSAASVTMLNAKFRKDVGDVERQQVRPDVADHDRPVGEPEHARRLDIGPSTLLAAAPPRTMRVSSGAVSTISTATARQ